MREASHFPKPLTPLGSSLFLEGINRSFPKVFAEFGLLLDNRSPARTSAGVTFEDRGEQSLKGVGEAVPVWTVVASRETGDMEQETGQE